MSAAVCGVAKGLRVGIVGGSIAGCAMAIELSRIGCEVTILERTGEELKDLGAGIGVPPSIFEMLVARDLIDADIPGFRIESVQRLCRTPEQAQYGYLAWSQPGDTIALNLGNLYRNLRHRVPDGAYRTRHQVAAIRQPDDDTAVAELADGYRSLGRQTLFPAPGVEYAGYVLWRGMLPGRKLLDTKPLEGVIVTPGYAGGHGVFSFVAGADGAAEPGCRLVNWAMYLLVPQSEYAAFFTDATGVVRDGTIPPGALPPWREDSLKRRASAVLPDYYAEIVERSSGTFAHAVYDCTVPAYGRRRICLTGDAAAVARPHTASGALNAITNAVGLANALARDESPNAALWSWNLEQTAAGNRLVQLGRQLGHAFVTDAIDWSALDEVSMRLWFQSIVTIQHEVFRTGPSQRTPDGVRPIAANEEGAA